MSFFLFPVVFLAASLKLDLGWAVLITASLFILWEAKS